MDTLPSLFACRILSLRSSGCALPPPKYPIANVVRRVSPRKTMKRLNFVAALGLLFAHSAFPQAITALAQLNGAVRDPSGAAVPRAVVTLRNVDTNHAYTTLASGEGRYILTNVASGNYRLETESRGFSNYTQTGIALTVGQIATIDVALIIATTTESVVVD